jgi:hypothetical protein
MPESRDAGDAVSLYAATGQSGVRQENRADPPQVSPSPLGWKFGSKLVAFCAHWAVLADSAYS